MKMKMVSFAIPCYNSEAYMSKCIESLLPGGEDVEIIIVDDGSSDRTAEIADAYAEKYPTIIKAVHQENGGHGCAVNTGLANATGLYFKVVDSDDWVDAKSYKRMLATLRSFDEGKEPDMVIANYVYEKVGAKRKKVIHYENVFPVEQMFTWNDIDISKFKVDQYILMHTVVYRTKLLKDCGLSLPKHTFYVDNIFVFEPLPYVKNLYYVNTNFYRYFIGREDQSVNESVMISRIDQQLSVNKRMIDSFLEEDPGNVNCRKYMINYLRIMMEVSSIFLIVSGTKENLQKKKDLWKYAKDKDEKLYRKLRYSLLGWSVNIPTGFGRWISKKGYKVANNIIGFN